jgi:3-deoxy-D-manno-octulosonic-acid transferase
MSWVLNCIYGALGALLFPYWLWKLPTADRYRAGIAERLGAYPVLPEGPTRLWVHCASVGEASIPRRLVAELRDRHPNWEIVFSTNTDTGASRLRDLYPQCRVFYMPLDFSFCTDRALDRVRPRAVVLVELEVWPNFLEACRKRNIPTAIVSGRIGHGSRKLLRALHRLWPPLWDPVRLCCARSADDAAGFRAAGVPPDRIFACGSLKYDALKVEPDAGKRAELAHLFGIRPDTPVLVAGSTHRGEEVAIGRAYRDLKIRHRDLRLIVAPRHIERAAEAAAALEARGLPVARRTALAAGGPGPPEDAVIVLDTIGELTACYGLATCAFVGRSLSPPGGGQNMMEPAALGKPVLVGPHTGNFKPEMNLLSRSDAVVVVRDSTELAREVDRVLRNPDEARRLGNAAQQVILQSQGATGRTLEMLEALLAVERPVR